MGRKFHEKTEFGQLLVDLIKKAGISQAEFIDRAGIAKPYFYDILKSSPPPRDTLEKMYSVLESLLPPQELCRSSFMNLAAQCRGEIPPDLFDLIMAHPEKWNTIQSMLTQMIAENNGT